jgi:hypothetical protein
LLGDLGLEGGDLLAERAQRTDVGQGGVRGGVAVLAGQPGRGVGEAGEQDPGRGAATVAIGGQPGAQAAVGQPGGGLGGGEGGQEGQADRRVKVGEQPDRAGKHRAQVGAELVAQRDPALDQVSAGSDRRGQGEGGWRVGVQRLQPVPVGAQGIGEDECVEAVVFVAGRSVAGPQVLDLAWGNHDHGVPGCQQGVDDWPVGPFNGDPGDVMALELVDEPADPGSVGWGQDATEDLSAAVDDAQRVGVGRPVDPGHAGRGAGEGDAELAVMLHVCLLAGGAVGKHPVVPGRARRLLTDRRSVARSPVAAWHVLGHRTPLNSSWLSSSKRAWRWSGGHQVGCASSLPSADTRRVHQ